MVSISEKRGYPRGLGRGDRMANMDYCRWPDCGQLRHDEGDSPPLCTKHLIDCAVYIAERMRISLLDPRMEARKRELAQDSAERCTATGNVVYYVRIGNHIKIGWTSSIKRRMQE